jgi:hypothetical protein
VVSRRQHASTFALKPIDGAAFGRRQPNTTVDGEDPQFLVMRTAQTQDHGVLSGVRGLAIARSDLRPPCKFPGQQREPTNVPIVFSD